MKQVDAAFVERSLRDGRTTVINVLSPDQFEQAHIPGSYNAAVERPGFDEAVQRFAPDKEKPVIVHCSNMGCHASTKAARKLEALGYKQVLEFKAGIEGWEQAGKPLDASKKHAQDEARTEARPQRPAKGQERERQAWEGPQEGPISRPKP